METAFVKAVEAIYTAAPEPTLWPAALQAIADCFDDVGGNLVWKRDDGELGVIVSDSLKLATEDYERKWWRYDIRSERAIERMIWARGDTICDRDTIKDHEITGHEFYTEFLAKHGLRWFACTGLCPDPRTAVGLAVQRSIHKSSFKESELDLLARLGKHAERSLRLTVRLLDAELTNVGLGDALSRLNIGVFALDSLGRVTFSNSAGERLLGDGITLVGGRLRIVASDQESANRSLLLLRESDDLDGADLKPILVPRSHSNRSLVVHVLPVPRVAQLQTAFLTHVSAIV
ncbi:MAG: helix-turn-helix transcriptional regulator, partial [Pirellulales bacterium]|nr:helix-turn-helix transcriptional regulator [Pirellulales bacterium]